jgi:zinc protease
MIVRAARTVLSWACAVAVLALLAAPARAQQPAPPPANPGAAAPAPVAAAVRRFLPISLGSTPLGIRLVHLRLPQADQQIYFAQWRDRHVLANPDRAGLQMLAPHVLVAGGTRDLDGGALDEELRDLRGRIQIRRSRSYTHAEASGPPERIGAVLDHLNAVMTTPRLPERTLERRKRQMLEQAREGTQRADSIASRALNRLVIRDHPLLRILENEPPGAIAEVTMADIEAWRRKVLTRDGLLVIAVGPDTREEAEQRVDAVFGALPAGHDQGPETPPVKPWIAAKTIVIERPNLPQAVVTLAGITEWSTNDGPHRSLALGILGGGSQGRLFRAIRDEMGAAYGANAAIGALHGRPQTLTLTASVAIDKAPAVLAAFRREYARFRKDGVTEAELTPAKARFQSGLQQTLARPAGIAGAIRNGITAGLSFDQINAQASRIAAVTLADVNRLIAQHLPETMLAIVVTTSAEGFEADCVVRSLDEIMRCGGD